MFLFSKTEGTYRIDGVAEIIIVGIALFFDLGTVAGIVIPGANLLFLFSGGLILSSMFAMHRVNILSSRLRLVLLGMVVTEAIPGLSALFFSLTFGAWYMVRQSRIEDRKRWESNAEQSV